MHTPGSDAEETSGRPVRTIAPELARRVPRVLLAIALALPVLLVVGVVVASQVLQREPPGPDTVTLRVGEEPAPAASSADCARFLSGIPKEIDTGNGLLPRRTLSAPAPAGTAAWGGREDRAGRTLAPPVVLRCGLPRPPELTPTAAVLDIDGVEWVQRPGPGASTWITVDRAVYVGLTVPDGSGSAAIQDVSRGVKITLASRAGGG